MADLDLTIPINQSNTVLINNLESILVMYVAYICRVSFSSFRAGARNYQQQHIAGGGAPDMMRRGGGMSQHVNPRFSGNGGGGGGNRFDYYDRSGSNDRYDYGDGSQMNNFNKRSFNGGASGMSHYGHHQSYYGGGGGGGMIHDTAPMADYDDFPPQKKTRRDW